MQVWSHGPHAERGAAEEWHPARPAGQRGRPLPRRLRPASPDRGCLPVAARLLRAPLPSHGFRPARHPHPPGAAEFLSPILTPPTILFDDVSRVNYFLDEGRKLQSRLLQCGPFHCGSSVMLSGRLFSFCFCFCGYVNHRAPCMECIACGLFLPCAATMCIV